MKMREATPPVENANGATIPARVSIMPSFLKYNGDGGFGVGEGQKQQQAEKPTGRHNLPNSCSSVLWIEDKGRLLEVLVVRLSVGWRVVRQVGGTGGPVNVIKWYRIPTFFSVGTFYTHLSIPSDEHHSVVTASKMI